MIRISSLAIVFLSLTGLFIATGSVEAQKGGGGRPGGAPAGARPGGAHPGGYHPGGYHPGGSYYHGPAVRIGVGIGYGYGYVAPLYYPYSYPYYGPYSVPRVSYYPAPTIIVQGPLASDVPTPANSNVANIRVIVPDPDAQVWFDGNPTKQRGTDRLFHTPPLNADSNNTYRIRASWIQSGKEVVQESVATVTPGQVTVVDFARPISEEVPPPPPSPMPKKKE